MSHINKFTIGFLYRYAQTVLDEDLKKAIADGPKSTSYTILVHYLTEELRPLCDIDEQVNEISGPEDSATFIMEVGSFLRELGMSSLTLLIQV